jgi:multicomponent Na+:H+ antiporter subunit E
MLVVAIPRPGGYDVRAPFRTGDAIVLNALLRRGAGFAFLWWVLAEGSTVAWGLGAVAVAAGVAASLRLLPPRPGTFSLAAFAAFVAFFLWQSMRGGLQVAAMALSPRPGLSPCMLDYPVALPPGPPRLLLVASLGLMPGTVGVRLDDDRLRLHVLDARLPAAAEAKALEAVIARLFGEDAA